MMHKKEKFPRLVVGSFIFDAIGRLYLRRSPRVEEKFTCINDKVKWGQRVEETLKKSVKKKTNLDIDSIEFVALTDGLGLKDDNGKDLHLIFADYKVSVSDISEFKSNDDTREGQWLSVNDWIELGEKEFGPYIFEILKKLK